MNQFGLELFRSVAAEHPKENLLISPYSLTSALALAYAGTEGQTHREMMRALHFPDDRQATLDSLGELTNRLRYGIDERTEKLLKSAPQGAAGFAPDPAEYVLSSVNRLYSQIGYDLRPDYLARLESSRAGTVEALDFAHAPENARSTINHWITDETHGKIVDLIPSGGVDGTTRAILVNALYFKALWASAFDKEQTKPQPFHVTDTLAPAVPTMHCFLERYDYREFHRFVTLALPYQSGTLQCVIILPRVGVKVDEVLAQLTPESLRKLAEREESRGAGYRDVDLYLPKLEIHIPTVALATYLKRLGLKAPFEKTGDFTGLMAHPKEPFAFAEIYHQTYLALDEHGTEAAAASALSLVTLGVSTRDPKPVLLRVNRPFLLVIQDRETGTCLFIGRVMDPR